MLASLLIATLACALLAAPATAAPSCAPFNDPGCIFGEDFESYAAGRIPGAPWAFNGQGTTGTTVTAPGLNGTSKKMTFVLIPDNRGWPGGCEGCPLGDSGVSGTSAVGTTFWSDFWVSYDPGFLWGCGTGNCSMKTFDLRGAGTQQRLLMTVWGSASDSPPFSKGHTYWSIYPNYLAGGTDASGSNTATEKFANVTDVPLQAGQLYHIVEVTVGTGTTGAYRSWVNGTLTHRFSGLQTTSLSPWTWNAVQVGGPAAQPVAGSHWSLDQIRVTTTNIAPSSGPTGPSGPKGPPPSPTGPTGP